MVLYLCHLCVQVCLKFIYKTKIKSSHLWKLRLKTKNNVTVIVLTVIKFLHLTSL